MLLGKLILFLALPKADSGMWATSDGKESSVSGFPADLDCKLCPERWVWDGGHRTGQSLGGPCAAGVVPCADGEWWVGFLRSERFNSLPRV